MTARAGAAVLLLAAATIGLGRLAPATWVTVVLASTVAGTALVALAAWHGARRGPRIGDDPAGDRWFALAAFAIAAIIRLLLLPADHYLSDDAFRYHWDGKVLVHGVNPYRHAPADDAVAALHTDAIDALINHPHVPTVYPPYAELVFAAGYLLSPGRLLGFQLLALVSEIVAWVVLFGEARRRRLPRAYLLLAAWLPLAAFESYLPGHTEALALPFVALFIVAVGRGRPAGAGISLGLACLVKPVALLFVPAAFRSLGAGRTLRLLAATAATVVLFYLPFLGAGANLTSSMLLMAREWTFNASLAAGLGEVLPRAALRPVLLVLLAAGVLAAAARGRDLVSRMTWALVALVVVTPALYPWYLLWAVPLLVLRPHPGLIALSGLAPLTHVAAAELYATGVWDPPLWPTLVAYGTFYALLAITSLAGRRLRGRPRRA